MKKKTFRNEWNFFKKSFKLDKTLFWVFTFDILLFFLAFLSSGFYANFMEKMSSKLGMPSVSGFQDISQLQAPLENISSLAKIIFLSLIVFFLFLYFIFTLSRSLIWKTILKKKFTFRYWMKFSLMQLCWFFIFIIPWFLILALLTFIYRLSAGSAFMNNIYIGIVSILLVIHFLIYIHFTSFAYFKFTEKNKIKAMLEGYALGFSKLKKALFPNFFIIIVMTIISIISYAFKLLPESIVSTLTLILTLLFLAWYRIYYASLIKKWC